jgi:hypothetical protein
LKEKALARPQTPTKGNSMRGLFLSFSNTSPILLCGVLALFTHILWAQASLPLEKVPIQFVDTHAPFARVSEAQTRFIYRRSPLTFEQNQGQADSRMRLLPHFIAGLLYLLCFKARR